MELKTVRMEFPEDTNIIIGQTHFIKTAEEVHMVGHTHTIDCKDPRFRAFMNFRWAGTDGGKCIDIWSIGWTDGETCFLKDIDFFTGKFLKNYVAPLSQFKAHIHPAVRDVVLGV